MSILRFTFEVPVGDGRIEQAKALLKYEKAVADFRKALGDHSYTDSIVKPRGPKRPKTAPPVRNGEEEHSSDGLSRIAE